MPELLMERPKMSLQMHETLKRYILRERRKKKEEDVAIEQKMQEEMKKVEINTQTLEKTKEQLRLMEIKLEDLQLKKRDLFNQLKKVLHEETNLKKQQSTQQQQNNIPSHLLTNFNSPLMPSLSPSLTVNGPGGMLLASNGNGALPPPPSSLPGQNNSKSPFHIPHPHVSNLPFMQSPTLSNLNKFIAAAAAAVSGSPSLSPQLLIPPMGHQSQVLGPHHNMLNYSPSSSPHLLSNSSPSRHSQQHQTSQSPNVHKRQRSPSPPQSSGSPHLGQTFIYNQNALVPSRSPAHGQSSPPLSKQQQQQQQFNSPVSNSTKKVRSTSSNQSPHHHQQMSNRSQTEFSQTSVNQNPQSSSSAFSQFNRINGGGGGITSGQVGGIGFQSSSSSSHSKSTNNRGDNGFSTPTSHQGQSPNFTPNRQQQQQQQQLSSHSPGIGHNFSQLNQHYLNQFTPPGAAAAAEAAARHFLQQQQQQQQSLVYQQQTIQMMAAAALHQQLGSNSNVVSNNSGGGGNGGGGGSILTGFSVRPSNSSSSGMSQHPPF